MPEEKKGLSDTTRAIMVSVAFFFDCLQILLSFILMGWLIMPVAYLTFIVWFMFYKLSFLSLKRAPILGIGFLLEMLSAGILPTFTFTVFRICLDNRLKKFAPALGIIKK